MDLSYQSPQGQQFQTVMTDKNDDYKEIVNEDLSSQSPKGQHFHAITVSVVLLWKFSAHHHHFHWELLWRSVSPTFFSIGSSSLLCFFLHFTFGFAELPSLTLQKHYFQTLEKETRVSRALNKSFIIKKSAYNFWVNTNVGKWAYIESAKPGREGVGTLAAVSLYGSIPVWLYPCMAVFSYGCIALWLKLYGWEESAAVVDYKPSCANPHYQSRQISL